LYSPRPERWSIIPAAGGYRAMAGIPETS